MAKRSLREQKKRATKVPLSATDRHESVVVYVHGIGNQPPPAELKLEWDLALFGKDLDQRSRMAYWSDLLHPPAGRPAKSVRRESTRSDSLDVNELLANAGVGEANDDAQAFALGLLGDFGVEDAATAARGVRKKILPLPGFLRKPISRAFLETLISDTAAYFFRRGMRARIRNRLIEQLQLPPDQPLTIVAHSQGSIIAYEVLSALARNQLALDALVTIGSPLGISEVQDFLQPAKLGIPLVVTRWANFADPLDPVALDKGLASDFSARPRPTVEIQDEVIVNSGTRRLVGFNPHSAVGYLAHPKVRRFVAEAMRMDVVGRFVIARDVAEMLALDDSARQPVLVEALEPGYPALNEDPERMLEVERAERRALAPSGHGLPALRLEDRIAKLAKQLRKEVDDVEAAEIDPLRRFVAARLTAGELRAIGKKYADLRVYAVWRSSRKAKHTWRSMRPIKADAALTSFGANGLGITWAVLDTGVQANHPHFDGPPGQRVIKEVWDCTRHGAPVQLPLDQARDKDGHGTHVSGIIAGRRSDGRGDQRGVAPLDPAGCLQSAEGQRRGRGRLDHQGARPHRRAERADHRRTGDPRRESEPRRPLRQHGVRLRLLAALRRAAPALARRRPRCRRGGQRRDGAGEHARWRVRAQLGDVDRRSSQPRGVHRGWLRACRSAAPVWHLVVLVARSDRRRPRASRTWSHRASASARAMRAFRDGESRSLYRERAVPAWRRRTCPGCSRRSCRCGASSAACPTRSSECCSATCTDLERDRYHQGRGMPNLMQMLLAV